MTDMRRRLLIIAGTLTVMVLIIAAAARVDARRGDGDGDGDGATAAAVPAPGGEATRFDASGALDALPEEFEQLFGAFDLGDRDAGDLLAMLAAFLREMAPAAPVLGVTVEEDGGGLVVGHVMPGMPAQRAGVERGDEILRVDGQRVGGIDELRAVLDGLEPGAEYELQVLRDGRTVTLEVSGPLFVVSEAAEALRDLLAEYAFTTARAEALPPLRDLEEAPLRDLPGAAPRAADPLERPALPAVEDGPRLGITAVTAPDGVRVAEVAPGSGAAAAGLRPGDVIVAAAGEPVSSVDALRLVLSRHEAGDTLSLTVLRDGSRYSVRVPLSAPEEVMRRSFAGTDRAAAPAPPLLPRGDADAAPFVPLDALAEQDGQAVREALAHVMEDPELGERLTAHMSESARQFLLDALLVPELRERLVPGAQGVPAPGPLAPLLEDERALDRLADLVAERLAARQAVAVVTEPAPAPASQAAAEPAPETVTASTESAPQRVYFGRVAGLTEESITLTGTAGPATLLLTEETQVLGAVEPAVGGLVAAVTRDRVVEVLVVVE